MQAPSKPSALDETSRLLLNVVLLLGKSHGSLAGFLCGVPSGRCLDIVFGLDITLGQLVVSYELNRKLTLPRTSFGNAYLQAIRLWTGRQSFILGCARGELGDSRSQGPLRLMGSQQPRGPGHGPFLRSYPSWSANSNLWTSGKLWRAHGGRASQKGRLQDWSDPKDIRHVSGAHGAMATCYRRL